MKEKVEQILDLMIAGLQKAGDIAQTELPKLVDDYVRYFMIQDFPALSMTILAFGVCLFVCIKRKASNNKEFRDTIGQEDAPMFLGIVFVAVVVIPGAIVIDNAKNMASLYFAPKAALLERFRR